MNVVLVQPDEVSARDRCLWAAWQAEDPWLLSPFFHPEFTRQVASVRTGVEVAILQEGGETVGFFPFQRRSAGIGGPVGGSLSDFHGVIARPGTAFDANGLIRGCRLRAWHFHHLVGAQQPFRPYVYGEFASPFIDLEDGFEAYCHRRAEAGSRQVRDALRKARKCQRELGALRLEPHAPRAEVFDALVRWKLAQYRHQQAINYLAPAWTRELLRRLAWLDDPAFGGMLSALYAGDRLAAVHLGLRAGRTLHVWFPAYDPDLADYSPGLVLFVKLAEAAAALGIRRIDLGKGTERYKVGLGTAAVAVAEGSVDLRPVTRSLRRGAYRFFGWLRASPLRIPARTAGRLAPRLRKWATFH
jgi:CelD/BcsL family acetyltransferase involved in cellulose biosynthesis